MKRPRKRYRPRHADPLAMWRAFKGSNPIAAADVEAHRNLVDNAITEFARGADCAKHWVSMADVFNVAESLCNEHLCSDAESRERIAHAQRVLAEVQQRHKLRGSWTLHASELETLREAAWVHHIQLRFATNAEFERAYQATVERVAQARAGNAAPGTIVIEGQIT
jgi:hypothetical protein